MSFYGPGELLADMDPLERVVRPIVEGQIRSFTYDHPEVLGAVSWFKKRPDRRETFVNSVSKRVVRDLLCSENRMRLVAALRPYDAEGG